MQPPADPQRPREHAVQPVLPRPVTALVRALEQGAANLDRAAVDKHRHVNPTRRARQQRPATPTGQFRVGEVDLDFRRIWDYSGHAAHLRGEGFVIRHFAIFTKRVAPHLYPASILIRE